MREIHRTLERWSRRGATFVGWNNMRFDELMLRQAYYQTLQPIYQTQQGANGRADAMRIAQAIAALETEGISVPAGADGAATFRLEHFSVANGIRISRSHEAMADAQGTLAVSRKLKSRCPELWSALIANGRKTNVVQLLQEQPVLLYLEPRSRESLVTTVVPIGPNAAFSNEWILFDLRFDPDDILEADDTSLEHAVLHGELGLRRVRVNSQPALFDLRDLPDQLANRHQLTSTQHDRVDRIIESEGFRSRISGLLKKKPEVRLGLEVEQRIYESFPSAADARRLEQFGHSNWDQRVQLIPAFEDDRLRQLAQRLLAFEMPELLSSGQRSRYHEWLRERLLTSESVAWRTIPSALAEASTLRASVSRENALLLDDFVSGLRKYEEQLRELQ